MNDLISRQSAIDVADYTDYTGLAIEDVKKVTDEVVKGLKRLPSIDAVQYTDDEIQRMQDIEQAQIEKAYDIGYAEGKSDAEPHWIPVTERLPKPKDGVLIYVFVDSKTGSGLKNNEFIDIGWFRADGDWDSELGCYDHKNITHWMPLPDPPKEEEE